MYRVAGIVKKGILMAGLTGFRGGQFVSTRQDVGYSDKWLHKTEHLQATSKARLCLSGMISPAEV